MPQDSYDLDVNPNKSNTASPNRNVATRAAPQIPGAVGTPPPLPKRQTAINSNNAASNELPKIPARNNVPPPLPARPNSQM